MRYLLLINKDEAKFRALSETERERVMQRYGEYGRRMQTSGVLLAGALLKSTESATTVRMRGDKRMLTDGPFAETAEQIAGIAIIDVEDLDQALDWAANHPDAAWASVEVRPLDHYVGPNGGAD